MSTPNPLRPGRIVIVLGMHRSGTSCLTGSLQQAGLSLGEHSTWNPFNQKGNRENTEITALHDAVLQANGGSWDNPPTTTHWSPAHRQQAATILANHAQDAIWGFKDPRTLLTLQGWLDLGIAPAFIGIFRSPWAVAHSLAQRSPDQMSVARGLELWYDYNARLLALHNARPFPLLCFDWEESVLHAALSRALPPLGLNLPALRDWFYTAELVHQSGSRRWLPWKVGRLYKKLRIISERYR